MCLCVSICINNYSKLIDSGSIENKIQMFNILNFFSGSTSNRGWRGSCEI